VGQALNRRGLDQDRSQPGLDRDRAERPFTARAAPPRVTDLG
jgi:hypothetical protein